MKLIITILISSFILSGCFVEKKKTWEKKEIGRLSNATFILKSENIIQDQRWEMLKEYLGVVEWTEIDKFKMRVGQNNTGDTLICSEAGLDNYGFFIKCQKKEDFGKEKTYLTSNPLKKEWVELNCEMFFIASSTAGMTENDKKEWNNNRCQELKELINN